MKNHATFNSSPAPLVTLSSAEIGQRVVAWGITTSQPLPSKKELEDQASKGTRIPMASYSTLSSVIHQSCGDRSNIEHMDFMFMQPQRAPSLSYNSNTSEANGKPTDKSLHATPYATRLTPMLYLFYVQNPGVERPDDMTVNLSAEVVRLRQAINAHLEAFGETLDPPLSPQQVGDRIGLFVPYVDEKPTPANPLLLPPGYGYLNEEIVRDIDRVAFQGQIPNNSNQ